jgi:hypothetical protein
VRQKDVILSVGTVALILVAVGVVALTGGQTNSPRGRGIATTTSSVGT